MKEMKRRTCGLCGGDGWTDSSAELRRDGRKGDTTCIACSGRGYELVPKDGTPGPRGLGKLFEIGGK